MQYLKTLVILASVGFPGMAAAEQQGQAERPNIILIVCDNLGYGDVGCFGSKLHRTPHIDRMAADGVRFTDFYITSGVCTAVVQNPTPRAPEPSLLPLKTESSRSRETSVDR
ncbi:MAG: sulfatase-like hydrolase/transferase [Planctomycetota bacterium]